jgi:hypothetical protein
MTGKMNHRRLAFALAMMATTLATGCSSGAPAASATARASERATDGTTTDSDLNGTYRWLLTQEDADKVGDRGPGYPSTTTVTLKDGLLEGGCFGAGGGTYKVEGDRITFHSNDYGYDSTVTFTRNDDGSLRLTPVPPMDPGDAFVCFYKPWTKID